MKHRVTAKKAVGIIVNILLYAFFAICLCALVFSLTAKRDSTGAVNLFGKQMRIVISPSMEKCEETDVSAFKIKDIPVNSLVFIELVPEDEEKAKEWYSRLEVGDVLTFQYGTYGSATPITHRITSITESGDGGYTILLAGDNKADGDGVLTQTIRTSQANTGLDYVIGRVTGQSRALGWIFTVLRKPVGLVLIIIIPCAIIIVMQIIRIIGAVGADKKKKAAEEKEQQESEIELLKRQIFELQAQKDVSPAAEPFGQEEPPQQENPPAEEPSENDGGKS